MSCRPSFIQVRELVKRTAIGLAASMATIRKVSFCLTPFGYLSHAIAEAAPQKIPNERRLDFKGETINAPDLVLAFGGAVFVTIHELSPCLI